MRKPLVLEPDRILDGPGFCIYCKVANDTLTDEHVVPYSLAGNIVLTKASCKKCSTKTSLIERKVSREFFGPFREALNFPTRRPKRRGDFVKHLAEYNGITKYIDIPVDNFPAFISLPILENPGIMAGRSLLSPMKINMMTIKFRDHIKIDKTLKTYIMINDWLKFVAKICHSAAYAFLGDQCADYEQFLPQLIIEGGFDMYYVGGEFDENLSKFEWKSDTSFPHYFQFERRYSSDGREALIVKYQMFSDMPTPIYLAVFGQKTIGTLPMAPLSVREPRPRGM